jgi:hypothetical protein
MPQPVQSYQNHVKLVPLFHYFTLPALGVYFIWSVVQLVRVPSVASAMGVLLALAIIMTALFARVFALRVQDRVIRLEMRLRLRELLPADLHGRIHDFTAGQLVALRFASDEELPGLAAQVLRDNVADKTAIKKMIRSWQADHERA